jgi:hypothetical protein
VIGCESLIKKPRKNNDWDWIDLFSGGSPMPKTLVALALFAASCAPALAITSVGPEATPQNAATAQPLPSATTLLDAAAARQQPVASVPARPETDFDAQQAGIWGVAILAAGLIAAALRRRRFAGLSRSGDRSRRRSGRPRR